MKAIILAAGASTRLRPLTDDTPKCLIQVGGRPLLQRTLECLAGSGVTETHIVVGFQAEKVRAFVQALRPDSRVGFSENPDFRKTNNAYSLLLARKFLEDGSSGTSGFVLLDSDILFSRGLLPYLLANRAENRIAVRVRGAHDREEVRVSVAEGNRIVEIGKRTPMDVTYGESVGIGAFSAPAAARLFEILERRMKHGGRTEFYEESFQQMIDEGIELTAVDVSDHPAIEIDTAEDLEAARALVFEV